MQKTSRRSLIKAGALTTAALSAPTLAKAKIRWRLQTYAGSALAAHVIKPAIDAFNEIAGERMQIDLYSAD